MRSGKTGQNTSAGFTHIRTVKRLSEFELAKNGLRVLHMYLPGSGTITSNIVYLVGSRHEVPGQTGLAHMLEHMLFKPTHDGSGKRLKELRHKILEDTGALMNATTWLDRTNYFFTVPAAYFKKALEVEAGRMRHLLIEDKEFLPERANVLSEYEMHAGVPLDALMTAMSQVAFVSHGYGHETLGHKPDLESMTTESLRAFYDTYYWPNNAMLTIVGDIAQDDALTAVRASFRALPRSPHAIPAVRITEPSQEGERRVQVVRENPLNLWACGFKVPNGRSYEWAVLHLIGAYLTDGPQSVLDNVLVDTHKASSVDATVYPTHDDGLFTVHAQLTDVSSHREVEEIILKELEQLAKKPIDKKRPKTLQTKLIADELYGRDGTYAVTSELTECIALGDWTRFYTFTDDIKRVTPRGMQEVARKYFQKNNRVVGLFIGTNKTQAAHKK